MLFISQDENDIKRAIPTAATITIRPIDNEKDILEFVSTWAKKIQQKHELDDQQAKFIIDTTCARARGKTPARPLRTTLR